LPVRLVKLNKEDPVGYYDRNSNILYFNDSIRSQDGSVFNNLYRLDLNTNLDLLGIIRKNDE